MTIGFLAVPGLIPPPVLKVIYVCRNPKDVCVSLQHHARNKPLFEYKGEFSDILRFFAEGRCAKKKKRRRER